MIPKNKEALLVKALRNSDVQAFDELFSLYGSKIYNFTYGYLKVKEDAEEVVQEVFFRVWKNRKKLNPELSFRAYIFKIAYHYIIEFFEVVSHKRDYKDNLIEESVKFTPKLDERIDYQNLLNKVDEIIEHLPLRQKEILIKRRKEGQPIKKIANDLGISPKTVENHLTEALKMLKHLRDDIFSGI
jgi:RNA polymerase sigma-70 factor (ECF subfamily)